MIERFVGDCQTAVNERAQIAWPEGLLLIKSAGLGIEVEFFGEDEIEQMWSFMAGAAYAAVAQPMNVDHRRAVFLIAVPNHKHAPAAFWVRHGTGLWESIPGKAAPWLALSTAGGFRKYLLTGERSPMRHAEDNRLFGTITDEPPPIHDDGRI